MRYHIRTGELDAFTNAKDHKQAAIKTLKNSKLNLGVCVVVNEDKIDDNDHSRNVYFLTQNILDECCPMRVVG